MALALVPRVLNLVLVSRRRGALEGSLALVPRVLVQVSRPPPLPLAPEGSLALVPRVLALVSRPLVRSRLVGLGSSHVGPGFPPRGGRRGGGGGAYCPRV